MATPAEAGRYWCRLKGCADWFIARVLVVDGHLYVHHTEAGGPSAWASMIPLEDHNGAVWYEVEWGPRIPSPARLLALETILASDCWVATDEGGFPFGCKLCAGRFERIPNERGGESDVFAGHAPDCPWQRAQEEKA